MSTVPVADRYSWVDGDDIILQDGGHTVRVYIDDLVDLHDHARSVDTGTARHAGHSWDRDHLAGAINLAVWAGLLDTCTAVPDGRAMCELPARPSTVPPRCTHHEKS